jgi:hypothetical protein
LSTDPTPTRFDQRNWQAPKLALVALGIIAGQVVLYGPVFIGKKILLPLGCLAEGRKYIPLAPGAAAIESPQPILLDMVVFTEPARRFAAREIAAGRFPRWRPHIYGGVPFTWLTYSPYALLSALSESPVALAWAQLFAALVAGFGAFAFCRRALKLSFWPSALAAWCYPLTGWFVLFQGYPTGIPVIWLPWICLAVDRVIQGKPYAPPALALLTGLVIVSGSIDIAGQVLLVSGLFAVWRVWDVHRQRCLRYLVGRGGLLLVLGWAAGFLLAAPHTLSLQEYAKTSSRLSQRGKGSEERPPVGILALPQLVLPDMYGTYAEKGTCPLLVPAEGNQLESPASGYTGLLAMILLAPWALRTRARRSEVVFFLALAGFGASWALNVPGVVQVLRLPLLNLMSHNRLVFATSFAVLALAAIGLESLLQDKPSLGYLGYVQAALLAGLLGWCLYRTIIFPEPLATEYERLIKVGTPEVWASTVEAVHTAQAWFSRRYLHAAALCAAGLVILFVLHFWPTASRRLFPVVGALLVADLLLFGYGKRTPENPSLYYPKIPALQQIAKAPPGRALGVNCMPANIAEAIGLYDVRGYDAFDPARWLDLLSLASDSKVPDHSYAAVQWYAASYKLLPPDDIRFSPILDMLSLRYAIFRGMPAPNIKPLFRSRDYWVVENHSALPRAFVPAHVEAIADEKEMLLRLGLPEFNPRKVAFINAPLDLPTEIQGSAEIKNEIPTRIDIEANMVTPGLLVVADNWDKSWQAYVNGQPTPILIANHSLRGIPLPPGRSWVELRYKSRMVTIGNMLASVAILMMLGWTAVMWRRRKASPRVPQPAA